MKYAVLICTLSDERKFVYRDVRRTGHVWSRRRRVDATPAGSAPSRSRETFTPFVFADRLRAPHGLKKADHGPRRLAGVGNIYANEALFDARLNPAKSTHKLSLDEFARSRGDRRCITAGARVVGHHLRDYRTGPAHGAASNSSCEYTVVVARSA